MVDVFDDSGRARRSGLRDQESAEYWALRSGMKVVGADGGPLGTVKEVRQTDFLLDRALAADLYVPYSACAEVNGDEVRLNLQTADVSDQGWATPGGTPAV